MESDGREHGTRETERASARRTREHRRLRPAEWTRIREAVARACELPAAERTARVLAAGLGPEATAIALRLLEADRRREQDEAGFLEIPATELLGAGAAPPPREGRSSLDGSRLGPYRVGRCIHRGTMGDVYEACRDQDFEQTVVIKLMKPGLWDDEAHWRFTRERQILAGLQHPNIARLYGGGSTPEGLPYLVMERIEGDPIDVYCARHRLGVRERIGLVRDVAAAVAAAHRQLLVHRDLKPSNVLVTPEGAPKLLDFGIAKSLDAGSDGRRTETGRQPRTPGYASPEQVLGELAGTGTDIHGLGLLLYELLTGCSPYLEEGLPAHEIERRIVEEEAAPPSTVPVRRSARRVEVGGETFSLAPALGPVALSKRLRGDLDAILARALAKDPADRYGSAEDLGADLGRFLRGEPVAAVPPSLLYRARRFFRRNRLRVLLSATVLASLAALATASWQHRLGLAQERAVSEQTANLLERILRGADPFGLQGRDQPISSVLAGAVDEVGRLEDGNPDLAARLFEVIGTVELNLDAPEAARPPLERALAIRRRLDQPRDVASSLTYLGFALGVGGRYEEAARPLEEAMEIHRRLGTSGPLLARTANYLGEVRTELGDLDEGKRLHRLAVAALVSGPDADPIDLAETFLFLAGNARRAGNLQGARLAYGRALYLAETYRGEEHPITADAQRLLGTLLVELGDYAEADRVLRRAVATSKKRLGPSHPDTLNVLASLAKARITSGALEAAEATLRELLEHREIRHVMAHAATLNNLGVVLMRRGELDEALAVQRQALAVRRGVWERGPAVAQSHFHIAEVLRRMGRPAEARDAYQRSYDLLAQELGPDHPNVAHPLVGLARLEIEAQRFVAAEASLQRVLELRRASLPPGHWQISIAQSLLGECLARTGRSEEGLALLRASREALEEAFGALDTRTQEVERQLAALER